MLARAAARIGRLRRPRAAGRCCCAPTCARSRSRPRFTSPSRPFTAFSTSPATRSGAVLRGRARALVPGGWFAFDTFAPNAQFLARANPRPRERQRRWGTTRFTHPATGRRIVYSESYRQAGRILHMTLHYQPVDGRGRSLGRARRVLLSHRQLETAEIENQLTAAGLKLIASWGGFDGRPMDPDARTTSFLHRTR
jgi:hypothetical protein